MVFLVPSSQKQLSVSQCIIQARRPRSVTALIPFGVVIDIDKSTKCKQLIKHFSRLGFSITPDELYRFKQSAIEDSKSEVKNHEGTGNEFKQWVADNVDHNITILQYTTIFNRERNISWDGNNLCQKEASWIVWKSSKIEEPSTRSSFHW